MLVTETQIWSLTELLDDSISHEFLIVQKFGYKLNIANWSKLTSTGHYKENIWNKAGVQRWGWMNMIVAHSIWQ